jgi:hypothetical protein
MHMPDLSRVAIRHVARINDALENLQRVMLDAAIKVGKALIAAQEDVPHGQWKPWLARHFPERSYRTLAVYMQVAKAPRSAVAATNAVKALANRASAGERDNGEHYARGRGARRAGG